MLILPRLQRGGGSKCQTIALRRRDRLAAVALPSTAPRNLPPQERTRPPERPQPGQVPHPARLLEADGPSRAPKKQHQAPEPAFRLEPLLPERQVPRRASPRIAGAAGASAGFSSAAGAGGASAGFSSVAGAGGASAGFSSAAGAAGASAGFSSAAGAGAAAGAASGKGTGLSDLVRRKSITSARVWRSGRPGKAIVVPEAKACGFVSQRSRCSKVQSPSLCLAFSAGE